MEEIIFKCRTLYYILDTKNNNKGEKMLTKEQSFSISLIRSLAILAIVSSHILQGYNNLLAWWLDVGVQVFLIMSGFIFGSKSMPNVRKWYVKRFKRVFKPYYIYLIIVIPIYLIFRMDAISYKRILIYVFDLQGAFGAISGLNHLWYITLIVFCYFITPLMYKYNIAKSVTSEIKFYSLMLVQFLIIQIIILNSFAPWIVIYMFGFYISGRYNYKFPSKIKYLIFAITILALPVKIYFQYFYIYDLDSTVYKILQLGFTWYQVFLGCTIFILLFDLFSKTKRLRSKKYLTKIVHVIDDYSYEIYITHHIFILGTFSILKITPYVAFNVMIIIMLTSLSALILKKISNIEFKQIYFQRKEGI